MNEKQRKTVDARIKADKEKFLELLEKTPVIRVVCKHLGIGKDAFYEWKNSDPEFAEKIEKAISEGRGLMVDMAETNLFSLVKEKHFPSVKLVLTRYHEDYKTNPKSNETVVKSIPDRFNLKFLFNDTPIKMHQKFQATEIMKWPLVIRSAYAKIWSGEYSRIIIKAPRGGGKSKLLGTIGFDLWYLKNRSVVNMGGSAVQATLVYNYFRSYCDIDESVSTTIDGIAKAISTKSINGNYFSSVTASTKQVRGKHPDVLLSDETCETTDELIHAALPMVDSSPYPLVVMASTFHKIFGIFQEIWDSAEERGYLRIQWDIFDVCKPFAKDFWDQPEIKNMAGVEKLKGYAKGRTGDLEGWVPVENVIQAWKEKPTEDWFEVEYMGSRPSAAGLVLKPEDVEGALFDSDIDKTFSYVAGATVVLGIDWGFSSMTAVTEFMKYKDEIVVMLDNINYHQTSSEEIIKAVVKKVRARGIRFIYADSAGKFENSALQNALAKENLGCAVIEVVFSTQKEGMLGNLRAHFEQGKIKIPKKFKEAYWQYKRYRYQDGTDKPIKKDDHIPDSTMCALQHFVLGNFARSMTIQPTSEQKNSIGMDGEPKTNNEGTMFSARKLDKF